MPNDEGASEAHSDFVIQIALVILVWSFGFAFYPSVRPSTNERISNASTMQVRMT